MSYRCDNCSTSQRFQYHTTQGQRCSPKFDFDRHYQAGRMISGSAANPRRARDEAHFMPTSEEGSADGSEERA